MKIAKTRRYRKYALAIYAVSILAGVVWQAGHASADDKVKLRIGTELSSEVPMSNLKPGDQVIRSFTVANDSAADFDYRMSTRFVSGDTEFFDVLQLTVKDGPTVIYAGTLQLEQQDIALGRLNRGEENQLDLNVIFPKEAGNEYQGKAATIAFLFSAYAEEPPSSGGGSTNPPANGPSQPDLKPVNGNAPATPGNVPTDPNAGYPNADAPDASGDPGPNGQEGPGDLTTPGQPESQPNPSGEPDGGGTGAGAGMLDELPQTANPWFNLIFISLVATVGTGLFLRKSGR
ncbi:hypothetical protein [Paenibacillus macerans]|uniref:hypothetical protein n=1 Tax=Paenibacillus macerans TaxID=44252 RepID=UPI003D319529